MYGQTSKRRSGQIVYEPRLAPWHAGNGGHGGSSFVPMLSETPKRESSSVQVAVTWWRAGHTRYARSG